MMVKRTVTSTNDEPDQKASYKIPSQKEHLLQIVDIYDQNNNPGSFKINDPDIVLVKLEVCGGEEEGRSIINRLSLDGTWKGFFATRLFLKACSLEYKGESFVIDTDTWVGKQFYADIEHNEVGDKVYANIGKYNFDKPVEQTATNKKEEINWDE